MGPRKFIWHLCEDQAGRETKAIKG
ncbi:hypothetical protein V3C99_018169 [Haemonchus contortus]